MPNYQLIAFDMDGTLLDSQKQVSAQNLAAISRAAQAGKTVILSTGRNPRQFAPYLDILHDIRYMVCSSGALVYDAQEDCAIYQNYLSEQTVLALLDLVSDLPAMTQLLSDEMTLIQRDRLERLDEFGMGIYKELFRAHATLWDDLYAQYAAAPFPIAKCNVHCADTATRAQLEQRIRERNIPVTTAYAETTTLEINAADVSKGAGLVKLCEHLDIPIAQTIAVGDAGNDKVILETAGLAVAMGNATPEIMNIADVVVADCDHSGCAEAVERYLLA